MDKSSRSRVARVAGRIAGPIPVPVGPGSNEGYAVPEGQIISVLQEILVSKYTGDMAYRSFSDRVKGPWRDSLVAHWYEHAEEERKQSYDVAMKIVGMGADPMLTYVKVPPCPPNVEAFAQLLAKAEHALIDLSVELGTLAGENVSLRVLSENMVLVDSQHLDDLRRMFGVD